MRIKPLDDADTDGATVHFKQGRHQTVLESKWVQTFGANWAAFAGHELVAVGGLLIANGLLRCGDDGIAAWLLFTDRITPGRFVAVYRELARRLAGLLDEGKTVLIHVDPDYPEAVRLAKKLGFRKTGYDRFDDAHQMIRMVASA